MALSVSASYAGNKYKDNPHNLEVKNDMRMSSEQVKAEGFIVGPVDGKMGPRTKNAIMQFQASYDIPTTGRLNQDTFDLLDLETFSE